MLGIKLPVEYAPRWTDMKDFVFDGKGRYYPQIEVYGCWNATIKNVVTDKVVIRSKQQLKTGKIKLLNVDCMRGGYDIQTVGDDRQVEKVSLKRCTASFTEASGLFAKRIKGLKLINFKGFGCGTHWKYDHTVYTNSCEDVIVRGFTSVNPASYHYKMQQAYGSFYCDVMTLFGGRGIVTLAPNKGSNEAPDGGASRLENVRIDRIEIHRLGEGTDTDAIVGISFRSIIDSSVGEVHVYDSVDGPHPSWPALFIEEPGDTDQLQVRNLTVERLVMRDARIEPIGFEDNATPTDLVLPTPEIVE